MFVHSMLNHQWVNLNDFIKQQEQNKKKIH
jgi:hypothetical protein